MIMRRVPQYGDPELLPKGSVTRPTVVDDALFEAADIESLPWKRARGDEWTLPDFRKIVFRFIVGYFDARDWPAAWDITEKASAVRSGRLPAEQFHLVLGVSRKRDKHRYETAVAFPPAVVADPARVLVVLNQAAVALDALHAADV